MSEDYQEMIDAGRISPLMAEQMERNAQKRVVRLPTWAELLEELNRRDPW